MPGQYQATIVENRQLSPQLHWLTLHTPTLSRSLKAGHYLLVRCADGESFDPLLRRAVFVAAIEERLEQIGLLIYPEDRGLAWLSRAQPGTKLDLIGPCGTPWQLDRQTRTVLLIGQGSHLGSLLSCAQQAHQRGCSVTLLASQAHVELLPPAYLLPAAIEYQTWINWQISERDIRDSQQQLTLTTTLQWADQVVMALPEAQLSPLIHNIRHNKLRWERGYATALISRPLLCGVGACHACLYQGKRKTLLVCQHGPMIDLREVTQ